MGDKKTKNKIFQASEIGHAWSVQLSSFSFGHFTHRTSFTQCVLLGLLLVAKEYLVSIIKDLICTASFLSCDVIRAMM